MNFIFYRRREIIDIIKRKIGYTELNGRENKAKKKKKYEIFSESLKF